MREDAVIVDKLLLTTDANFVIVPNTILGTNETPREITVAPKPTILNPRLTGGTFQFSLLTESGPVYLIQSTPGLEASATWSPVSAFKGNGNLMSVSVPIGSNTRQFFRALVPSEWVVHADRKCNTVTSHCDINDPGNTCYEIFENGVFKGCASR
jgi:hypothetical protein